MQGENGGKIRKTYQLIQSTEILESISDCFLALDRDWCFAYLNKRAAADLGVKPGDLLGQIIWVIYPAAANTGFAAACRRAMDNRVPEHLEVCGVASSIWHNIRIYPSRDSISVYWLDSTQHKMNNKSLLENEENFYSLFNNMTEGFQLCEIILDDKGIPVDYKYLEINPAFEKMSFLSREKLIGKRIKEIFPDIESFWIETYGRVALTGQPVLFERCAPTTGKWLEVYAYSPLKGRFAALFR